MKPRVGGGGRLDHRFQSGVWPPVANFVQHRSVATPNEVRVLDNGRRARVTPPRSRVTGFEVASYVSSGVLFATVDGAPCELVRFTNGRIPVAAPGGSSEHH